MRLTGFELIEISCSYLLFTFVVLIRLGSKIFLNVVLYTPLIHKNGCSVSGFAPCRIPYVLVRNQIRYILLSVNHRKYSLSHSRKKPFNIFLVVLSLPSKGASFGLRQ